MNQKTSDKNQIGPKEKILIRTKDGFIKGPFLKSETEKIISKLALHSGDLILSPEKPPLTIEEWLSEAHPYVGMTKIEQMLEQNTKSKKAPQNKRVLYHKMILTVAVTIALIFFLSLAI